MNCAECNDLGEVVVNKGHSLVAEPCACQRTVACGVQSCANDHHPVQWFAGPNRVPCPVCETRRIRDNYLAFLRMQLRAWRGAEVSGAQRQRHNAPTVS